MPHHPDSDIDRQERRDEPDWSAIARSPEFAALVRERRRFVVPATIGFFAWYFGFILLTSYAPDFVGSSVSGGLTVGYCLMLSQFAMVWLLVGLYLRRAQSRFDPLAQKALDAFAATTPEDDERRPSPPAPTRAIGSPRAGGAR